MATAMTRDAGAAATSAPPPSAASQPTPASSSPDDQQTTYACTLHGLIPNPPPSAATTADPNTPTLSNLFAVLSSITPRHSGHLDDYSQHALVSDYALYRPASLADGAQQPLNGDRPLHSRLTALAALLHANHTDARIFCHYERVYAPANPTPASTQPPLPLRLTRPAIPHLPTTPYLLIAHSRPLPPNRHLTHTRAIRTLPLYHIAKVGSVPSAGASGGAMGAGMGAGGVAGGVGVAGMVGGDGCDGVMELLGYRFDWEWVKEGFVWLLDGAVSVSVWRVCRLGSVHDLSSVEAVRGMQWVVEVSAQAVESQLGAVEERVVNAAKALLPLVKCSKVVPET